MKICKFHIGNNTIEFRNTIWGVEKMYYNEVLMSKRYSTLGTTHFFSVVEDDEWAEYEIQTYADWSGNLACRVYRNDEFIDEHWGRLWGSNREREEPLMLV